MAIKKSAAKPATKKPVAKKPEPAKKVAPAKKAAAAKPAVTAKKPVKAAQPATKKAAAPAKKAEKPAAAPKKAPAKEVTKAAAKPTEAPKAPAKAAPAPKKAAAKPAPKKSLPPTNAKDIKIAPAKAVSIPKINTKTSRTYKPAFTQSVLDEAKTENGAVLTRYSDSDLTEFRELIQRKLTAAKKELNYLQGLITRKDEMGGDESENRYMTMEDGSLSMEREQLSQMASRQITFTDHLEKALMRIENKTYGICRVTGKLIEKARLKAVPHATLSMEAKLGQNNR